MDTSCGEQRGSVRRIKLTIRHRWLRRTLAGLDAALLLTVAGGLVYVRTEPFGAHPSGERQARVEGSPQWRDGEFRNPQPQWLSVWKAATSSNLHRQ
jgi:hypothetical protein